MIDTQFFRFRTNNHRDRGDRLINKKMCNGKVSDYNWM